jgi:hypothetical protein
LYGDQDILHNAITFLDNQPDGPLFSEKSISYKLDKTYGCCNTTLRKYWESRTHKSKIPKLAKIALANWMDHRMDTVFKNYLIEKQELEDDDPVIELDDESRVQVEPITQQCQTEPIDTSHYDTIIRNQEQEIEQLKTKVAKLESINKKYLELINLVN